MSSLAIRYLGHSAFQINSSGRTVLIDPFVSENLGSDVELSELRDADILLISHGAWDHLGDSETLLRDSSMIAVCAPEVHRLLVKAGIPEERLRLLVWGGIIDVCGVGIRAVENRHISHVRSDDQFWTGMPLSFIVSFGDGLSLYHAGDTSLFSDLRLIAELYRPKVGLIPIGSAPGFFPELPPNEAALASLWLGCDLVIPMHYTEPDAPKAFEEAVRAIGTETKVVTLSSGQSVEYVRDVRITVG